MEQITYSQIFCNFLRTKKIITPILTIVVFILTSATSYSQDAYHFNIFSPNKKIKVLLSNAGQNKAKRFSFSVYYKRNGQFEEVLLPSLLGLKTKDQDFDNNLSLVTANQSTNVYDSYQMIDGKRKNCRNVGTQQVFNFINANGKELNIIFRVYNDGVAFRYKIPGLPDQQINVTDEYTTYNIATNTGRWVQRYDPSYEDYYPYSKTGKGENGQQWGYPALFKINNKCVYFLISEAANTEENCAARLNNEKNYNSYKVTYLEPRGDFKQQGIVSNLPWQSQWHTIIIGSLANIVESTLITDVSAPNKLKDVSWIKPGAAAWVYWANNHGSKDYKKVTEYVDLAKNMGWPYVLIDWEWDVMGNGGNVEDAVNYAKSKGIEPLLWYNSGTTGWADATPLDRLTTKEKREKEFQWLNKIGVYGIKVDFFAGDQQDMMKLYLDILKDAANYHLMVDFHGATIPRGWSRTYPNLMTVEAVYGAEWYNNKDVLTIKAAVHNTTLPFTRNVIGSMDYTPVTFSNSQHPHTTTYAHELALSVVFESALQNFADRPEAYENLPDAPKNFLRKVPTAWDETKLLDGFPGKKVIIARKKGSTWYIGGLNGLDTQQTLTIPFESFHSSKIKLHLIKDGNDDKSFLAEDKQVNKKEPIQIKCLPRGGFVGYFLSSK